MLKIISKTDNFLLLPDFCKLLKTETKLGRK